MFFTVIAPILIIFWMGLASIGRHIWIHQKYAEKLLILFEFCRNKIENSQQKRKNQANTDENFSTAAEEYDPFDEKSEIKMNGRSPHTRQRTMSLSMSSERNEFHVSDITEFVRLGIQAIVDDEVTKRFAAEELKTWNLLTRTNKFYHYSSLRLWLIWLTGFLFRYLVLFPIRFIITIVAILWLIVCTASVGFLPDGSIKRNVYYHVSIMCFRVLSPGFSGIITYHNPENKAKGGGICVANHTSPIDITILHGDNSYALVGQMQGGLLGVIQRALARATPHIWFDRFEVKDRSAVTRRLKEHVENADNLPILIFPEGTCINNSAVMMFKKGSFEVGGNIYPAAIKYDQRFGDPFWNSSKYGYMRYLLMMMTSWAIVCDVWYLPPMTRQDDESGADFAARVKAEIARAGGLVDLEWDGQLKRQKVKPELKEKQQRKFSRRIIVDQALLEVPNNHSNNDHTNNAQVG